MATDVDRDEFAAFAADRYARMVRAAVLMGAAPADAEDAVQDALARCYAAWPRVRSAADPDAYAFRVLLHGVRRAGRRRWRGEVPHADLPDGDRTATGASGEAGDPAARVAVTEPVRAALRRLGAAHRQVLVLRYVADLSEQRTAEVLGVPVGTVKSRAARAAALLARDPALTGLTAGRKETT
jgi:RNA polymerase sigma-70 factor (sigma-E family)